MTGGLFVCPCGRSGLWSWTDARPGDRLVCQSGSGLSSSRRKPALPKRGGRVEARPVAGVGVLELLTDRRLPQMRADQAPREGVTRMGWVYGQPFDSLVVTQTGAGVCLCAARHP